MTLPAKYISAQEYQPSLGIWKFKSISGEINLTGLYAKQDSYFNDIPEEQKSGYYIGGIKLNTSSYLWQEDIISINLNGEFNPETRNEKYLSIPDRSEVRTLKKFDFRSTIFSNKSISLITFYNVNQNYYNRESLTNIKSNNRQYGAVLSLQNKFLPIKLSYRNLKWEQTETESRRTFQMDQNNFQAKATKSFYTIDKHTLTYLFDDYHYRYSELANTNNTINRITLNDQLFFDGEKKYSFNSNISFHKQSGTHNFNKLEATERLLLRLPHQLNFNCTYNHYLMDDAYYRIITNRIKGALKHQLFESLSSELYIDLPFTSHNLYTESNLKAGVNLRYTKKIPFGIINIGYQYYRHHNSTESEEGTIRIINEEHTLGIFNGSFLARPFVDPLAILITDITGTIFYQEGLDYLVEEINSYSEITRIPGGQISEDQEVLVNYSAIQPGSYQYDSNNNTFSTSLVLLGKLIEIYYRNSSQTFIDPMVIDFLTLNQFNQNVIGGKINYKFIAGGVEYDQYNSNLIPYKKINYFLNLNFKIKSKIAISINSSLRDYKLLDTYIDHRYTNISGRLAYQLSKKAKLNFQAGYLNQKGVNIDLNLLTARAEFVTNHRKLYFKTGLNIYNRSYINNEYNYSRIYVQLKRKF